MSITNRTRFPLYPKPLDDELLSSWIVRLAFANGCTPKSFCTSIWTKTDYYNRDIDLLYAPDLFEVLAKKTGNTLNSISQTSLLPLASILESFYEPLNYRPPERYIVPQGIDRRVIPWIIPINLTQKINPRLQYCPQCLVEDAIPYFRRKWRLAFVTLCEKHHLVLLDQCLECKQPIKLRLSSYSNNFSLQSVVTICNFCGADLRTTAKDSMIKIGVTELIDFQVTLLESLSSNFVEFQNNIPIRTNLFFPVLHKLARLLSTEIDSDINRLLVEHFFYAVNCEFSLPPQLKCFEVLGVEERLIVINMIRILLEDFPINFVCFCKKHFTSFYGEFYEKMDGEIEWTGPLLDGFESIPYWYFSVVREYLIAQSWRYENIKDAFEREPIDSPIHNQKKIREGIYYVKIHKRLDSREYISPINKMLNRTYSRALTSYWEKILTWQSEEFYFKF